MEKTTARLDSAEAELSAFRDDDNLLSRGVVVLDENGEQAGIESNPFVSDKISLLDLFTTFNDILKEMKKMNLQLAIMTDNLITNQDVEI